MKAKYVVLRQLVYGCEEQVVYVFPEIIKHLDFVRQMESRPALVTGAGFVSFGVSVGGVAAYGESISLGVKSDPGDSDLIARQLGIGED